MDLINSKDNQKLKLIRSLHLKKHRSETGLFLAEGLRLCEEAALHGDCRLVLFAETSLQDERTARLADELVRRGVACLRTTDALFAGVAATDNPQGVLAVCSIPKQERPQAGGWFAYCDGLADPGNLGAVMRSAAATACSGLLLSPGAADPWNPKAVRASMGAVFRLPLWQAPSDAEALALLDQLQAAPLVTAMDGRDVRSCGEWLSRSHCWILGAEAQGVSPFWRRQAAVTVSLPMAEGAESLNVSCAATVLFYQSFFSGHILP